MKSTIKKILNSNIFRNSYTRSGLLVITGIIIGWLFFGKSSQHSDEAQHLHEHELADGTVWTCSMHPQIKMDQPGQCPICAMDLIPLQTSAKSSDTINLDMIPMSDEAIALAEIQTSKIGKQGAVKEIQLYGTIQIDERLKQSQTSHVNGRIEKLQVNTIGEFIRKGQTLASIYSPELLNAQQELLEAVGIQSTQPELLEASIEKLRLWKLTENQINSIIKSGKVNPIIDIKSNSNGVVISKNVNQGDYITQGSTLYTVADLSQVWAVFDAYETDLPFLKAGDKIDFTLQAIPGKTFSGNISFIDPLLDKTTRTSKLRVVTSNPGMQLKPEMYATATANSQLSKQGEGIVIPKSAVLWTGKRSLVYVKQSSAQNPAFKMQEIVLGPSLGNAYVVISGLEEGDEVVTRGAFSIDAAAQLEGKRSMMNTEQSKPVTGHEGHNVNTSNSSQQVADHDNHNGNQNTSSKTIVHKTIKVEGLCDMCKDRIEKTALKSTGVSSASWDKKTKVLHLNFDSSKTSLSVISSAIAKVGHDTEQHKADDKIYDALPSCCKYRK